MLKEKRRPGRKFKPRELAELRTQLKEAGISQTMVAKYSGYYLNQVNQALHGSTTITNVVEAARELLANPSLLNHVPERPHQLKAKLAEAGWQARI